MKTLIIDYGLCNLDSVKRAVEECGGNPVVELDPQAASIAEKLILPGVGNFYDAMQRLRTSGWYEILQKEVLENKIPILGICLGMQLLATYGEEGGGIDGLGFVKGKVIKLIPETSDIRIPHIGWNEVRHYGNSILFKEIPSNKDFYFVHSYHFVAEEKETIIAMTPYCGQFVSAVESKNIFGVQFHPEKSQRVGFQLLKNFIHL